LEQTRGKLAPEEAEKELKRILLKWGVRKASNAPGVRGRGAEPRDGGGKVGGACLPRQTGYLTQGP